MTEETKPQEELEREAAESAPQESGGTDDKFREGLEDLLDKIQNAVQDVITLEVVTIVGDVSLKDMNDPTGELKVDKSHVLKTQVDLIQGDDVGIVDNWYLAPENKHMRDYHDLRAKQGQETINKNVETLKELAQYVQDLLDKG